MKRSSDFIRSDVYEAPSRSETLFRLNRLALLLAAISNCDQKRDPQ
jgi:hypothetical protein